MYSCKVFDFQDFQEYKGTEFHRITGRAGALESLRALSNTLLPSRVASIRSLRISFERKAPPSEQCPRNLPPRSSAWSITESLIRAEWEDLWDFLKNFVCLRSLQIYVMFCSHLLDEVWLQQVNKGLLATPSQNQDIDKIELFVSATPISVEQPSNPTLSVHTYDPRTRPRMR